ncbi:MAG: hypothetical protein R3190_09625 [Thermoanaerobaculia bacterium]|nr:hypothetical protein [Thermoanaerobaculia bacterium]
MLAFVTALPHPHNVRSYPRVGELLGRSLAGLERQTCDAFTIRIAGNGPAPIELPPSARWVDVDLEPAYPRPGPVPPEHLSTRVMRDKGLKLASGILAARDAAPSHYMLFDYDDLLSRRLAEHCRRHPDERGWYADRGYVYWEGSGRITAVRDFSEVCGSSFVLRRDLLSMPPALAAGSPPAEIAEAVGERFLVELLARHVTTRAYLRETGVELAPLPFPAAVWMRGTGENASRYAGYPSLLGTPVSDEIRDDFGLTTPPLSLRRDLAAFPAQALGAYPPLVRRFGLRRTVAMSFRDLGRRLGLGRERQAGRDT